MITLTFRNNRVIVCTDYTIRNCQKQEWQVITSTDVLEKKPTSSSASNTYEVVFDGREEGVVVEFSLPKAPYTRQMETTIGDYLQHGSAIGNVAGRPFFLNIFVHEDGKIDLEDLIGKKVVGYPVVMRKTMPDGRTYLHVDFFLTSPKEKVTHMLVANANVPSENWWKRKAGRTCIPNSDILFDLPAPATGLVALMRR